MWSSWEIFGWSQEKIRDYSFQIIRDQNLCSTAFLRKEYILNMYPFSHKDFFLLKAIPFFHQHQLFALSEIASVPVLFSYILQSSLIYTKGSDGPHSYLHTQSIYPEKEMIIEYSSFFTLASSHRKMVIRCVLRDKIPPNKVPALSLPPTPWDTSSRTWIHHWYSPLTQSPLSEREENYQKWVLNFFPHL